MAAKERQVKQIGQRAAAAFLEESGWEKTKHGWKRPELHWAWPLWAAVRAQKDIDRGHWKP